MNTPSFDAIARRIPYYGQALLRLPESVKEQAFDIHLVKGQPVSVSGREGVFFLAARGGVSRTLTEGLTRVTAREISEIFVQTCSQSVFSHENELRQGYVLMDGRYRVGVCGTAVLEMNRVKSLRSITSLVYRIPREVMGCGDRLFLEGVDLTGGLLVIGVPSSGKTTLLRDLAYSLSTGKFAPNRRVAVLDERGEIGGDYDLGPCADILRGYPKAQGFEAALKMLSPEIVLCDELSPGDLEAVQSAVFAGVSVVASLHGGNDALNRPLARALIDTGAFKTLVYLAGRGNPGEIESIKRVEGGGRDAFFRRAVGTPERLGSGIAPSGQAQSQNRRLAGSAQDHPDFSDRYQF